MVRFRKGQENLLKNNFTHIDQELPIEHVGVDTVSNTSTKMKLGSF